MKKLVLAAALGMCAASAFADDSLYEQSADMIFDTAADAVSADTVNLEKDRTGPSLRATASSLGLGGELTWRFTDRFGVRSPFGSAEFDFDEEFEDQRIDGKVKTGGVGFMLDYYPMGGAFHVSGGAFRSDYSLSGTSYDVGIDGYTTDVDVEFSQKDKISPMAAMGWDWQVGKHGIVTADLGAIFGSGFDVNVSESSGMVSQESVDAEFEDVREEAGKIEIIPYIKFGIGFKF